jgi:pyruvate formate lyase activating enzyme
MNLSSTTLCSNLCSDDELQRLTDFIASVSAEIPWHATGFHKDYKMTDPDNTTAETLVRAAAIGSSSGLRYVYAGNLPGEVGDLENTRCHNCQQVLIERFGYLITGYHLTSNGSCPSCGIRVPGRWAREFQGQITAHPFLPHARSSLFSILRASVSI